jgi:hypothetical protein
VPPLLGLSAFAKVHSAECLVSTLQACAPQILLDRAHQFERFDSVRSWLSFSPHE